MKISFVLGKFYPLHIGHISLIQFAQTQCDKLIVLVDNHSSYNMPLADRVKIIQKTFPHLEVRGIKENTFQEPSESPDFWPYWTNIIKQYIPEPIHSIIGSMAYVKTLAEKLNIDYVIIDNDRLGINISATEIRQDLKEKWNYLAPESKAFFTKKIALMGAESSGKSTMCKNLAQIFNTCYVPEYGRTYTEFHGDKFVSKDFLHIAKAHEAHAHVLQTTSNKYFFYDTEALVTSAWHEYFLNTSNSEVEDFGKSQNIDLYILLPIQDHWEADPVRYHQNKKDREEFYEKLKNKLVKYNKNFIEIKTTDFALMTNEVVKYIKENL